MHVRDLMDHWNRYTDIQSWLHTCDEQERREAEKEMADIYFTVESEAKMVSGTQKVASLMALHEGVAINRDTVLRSLLDLAVEAGDRKSVV